LVYFHWIGPFVPLVGRIVIGYITEG